ncbi:DUF3180 domain-containing protein [Corynebacterium sp. TAE3-ERU12]|uniref:DUF3180 domain-containing protein n=1 Tax=Corynebacterium sp. TAE3-ERU12 TaxID=2849491 RepID=UPI001C4930E1|nr:DUF3180 domain-containing protein [Corynebacterium sp. TAE3-ERU12]MBV7295929.1 DUF3180 domain-containing protein [Corynebacterium sp. TAE3-ERU12]
MQPTKIRNLVLGAVCAAVVTYPVLVAFYSQLVQSWWDLLFPWVLIAVCVIGSIRVRNAMSEDNRIGQDTRQVNPVDLARWVPVGTASAWLGAILTGAYIAGAMYVVPRSDLLTAAKEETPVVLVGIATGLALTAAGLWLEKTCQLPPEDGDSPRLPGLSLEPR